MAREDSIRRRVRGQRLGVKSADYAVKNIVGKVVNGWSRIHNISPIGLSRFVVVAPERYVLTERYSVTSITVVP